MLLFYQYPETVANFRGWRSASTYRNTSNTRIVRVVREAESYLRLHLLF
jgi:hypothetical protein